MHTRKFPGKNGVTNYPPLLGFFTCFVFCVNPFGIIRGGPEIGKTPVSTFARQPNAIWIVLIFVAVVTNAKDTSNTPSCVTKFFVTM